MDVRDGRDNIGAVVSTGKLLPPAGSPADQLGPRLGRFQFPALALLPGVHESFFQVTVMNVPIQAPVARGIKYQMHWE